VRWETLGYNSMVANILGDKNVNNYESRSIFDEVIRKIKNGDAFSFHSVQANCRC